MLKIKGPLFIIIINCTEYWLITCLQYWIWKNTELLRYLWNSTSNDQLPTLESAAVEVYHLICDGGEVGRRAVDGWLRRRRMCGFVAVHVRLVLRQRIRPVEQQVYDVGMAALRGFNNHRATILEFTKVHSFSLVEHSLKLKSKTSNFVSFDW